MAAALYHVEFGMCQRSRGDHAVKVSAYAAADRYDSGDGRVFDFTRKQDEHAGHAVMLPDAAPAWAGDAGELFRRSEAAERRIDAQTARLVEFSIPREVAPADRMAFAQAVVGGWVRDGMAAQIDLHNTVAADGAEQPHAHVVLTVRRFDGNGFAPTKAREWNQAFVADKGRAMRGDVAERMNQWLAAHGLDARVDHRTHAEQGDLTPPERNAPRRAWDTYKADPTHPSAAPVRETLAARTARRQMRAARRAAAQATAEGRALAREWDARQPGLRGPGRRHRRGEPLVWDEAWTPPIGGSVAAVAMDAQGATITLADGSAIMDRGDRLTVHGRATDAALAQLAEQARRHGWQRVELIGDTVFRDRLAAALKVRGITTANAPEPSRAALKGAEKQIAAKRAPMPLAAQSAPAAPTLRPAVATVSRPQPDPRPTAAPSMGYVPPWAKGPRPSGRR